jgi:hypothetical protein
MAYYVYTLKSIVDGTFYKGSTPNPATGCNSTIWVLAIILQPGVLGKKLKRGNENYFEKLISSEKNIVHKIF